MAIIHQWLNKVSLWNLDNCRDKTGHWPIIPYSIFPFYGYRIAATTEWVKPNAGVSIEFKSRYKWEDDCSGGLLLLTMVLVYGCEFSCLSFDCK